MLRLAPKPTEGVIQEALHRMPHAVLTRLDRDLDALLQQARVRDRRATMRHLAEP